MDCFVYSHVGGREGNEDFADYYQTPQADGCFVVCDGLGGHGKGEVASQLVVKSLLESVEGKPLSQEELLEDGILYAQNTLLQAQRDLNAESEMKTTVVALRIFDNQAQWAHVGDSRLYLFRKKKVFARTLDHSVPQMLVAAGERKGYQKPRGQKPADSCDGDSMERTEV